MIGDKENAYLLGELIPSRLNSIELFCYVYRLTDWARKPKSPMRTYFYNDFVVVGSSAAFTNSVLEIGLIHCRGLLEFLGIRVNKGKISQRPSKRDDDFGIENLGLPLVTPQQVFRLYSGPEDEAERALTTVCDVASKVMAHLTKGPTPQPGMDRLLDVAGRGLGPLVTSYVYSPLGLPPPPSAIKGMIPKERYHNVAV